MIPTPVRSVPDPTVGALRLPTSMQTGCDRFPRMSGYARRKDFAVSRTQTKQRFRTLALIIHGAILGAVSAGFGGVWG